MSQIVYNLMSGSSLVRMVPPMMPGSGAYGDGSLPLELAGSGMYLVNNTITNNRYAGFSSDLAKQFATCVTTITEMGISEIDMNQIWLFWGTASTQNTPGYLGNDNPAFIPVSSYSAPLFTKLTGPRSIWRDCSSAFSYCISGG